MVQTASAPNVDGVMDEPVWSDAAVISNFTQVRPREGAQPSEKTEVRLLYDSDHLYLGVRAHDSEPGKIIARQMQRDVNLRSEDRIRFTLDTFHDRRNGYYFAINARGSRQDGLVVARSTQGGGYEPEWDGIWEGQSSIDDLGWVTEIAIPTKTLNFDPKSEVWGFNIERDIERKGERVRWSGPTRNKHVTRMSDAGEITHLRNLTQGRGIDFIPYAKLNYRSDDRANRDDLDAKPGFDLFYKITPAITAALTVNTDFAETEVDTRQVNLTRFPLFFEEKRDFFLQDATIFGFAKIDRSPVPFHSRRIGLTPRREPLDILAGGKLTGRIGRMNFGLLNVQVDEFDELDSKNLSAARANINLFGESETGIILTHGDPVSNRDNTLIGYDFNFKDSDFRSTGQIVEAHFYIMKTFSTGLSGDDLAFGGSFEYPNDKWDAGIKVEQIEANFNPALGFVDEPGARQYQIQLKRSWHPERLETIDLLASARFRTRIDGELIDGEVHLPMLRVDNRLRDSLELAQVIRKEHLFEPFEIMEGILIPPGNYTFNRYQLALGSSGSRAIDASVMAELGDFYGGTRDDFLVTVGWRPSPHFNFAAVYETNQIDLPQGDFTVNLLQVDINVLFSPTLIWNITNQWDSETNEFGINSRIRWTLKPGNDIYFVVNQGIDTSAGRFRATNTDLSGKVAWTFRF